MNKDKAIQLLERLQDPEPYEPMLTKDAYDAIQMAIDALSADGDTISREAAIEALDDAEDAFGYLKRDWREVLNELPSAQPEIVRCKDCKNYKFGMCLYSMTSGVGKLPNGFCDWAEKREVTNA